MNIFTSANEIKAKADSKKRVENHVLRNTMKVPYFQSGFRTDKETVRIHHDCSIIKPVTGTFILSYFTALAYCIVQAENADRIQAAKKAKKKPELVTLTTYIVQALIESEGFTPAMYAGKKQGFKRIEEHIKAVEVKDLSVEPESQEIKGLNQKQVDEILTSF